MPVWSFRKVVGTTRGNPHPIIFASQTKLRALSFMFTVITRNISRRIYILDVLRFILSTTRTTLLAHRLPTVPCGFVSVKKVKSLVFVTGVAYFCSTEGGHRVCRRCRRLLPFRGRVLRNRGQLSISMLLPGLNKPDLARRKNSMRQRSVQLSRGSPSSNAIPMSFNVIANTSWNGRSCPM